MHLRKVGMLCSVAMVLAACSGGGGDSTGPGGSNNNNNGSNGSSNNPISSTVTVANNNYQPGSATIATNGTVTWNWASCSSGGIYGDEVCVSHSVTFDDGVGSDLQSSGSFARTFTKAGTYKYHCTVHGSAMSGTITVQ